MALLKNDNYSHEFLKAIIGFSGIRLVICLVLFAIGCFSFAALVIPSILNLFSIFSPMPLLNFQRCLLLAIEGSLLSLLFGLVFNISSYWKNYHSEIKNYIAKPQALKLLERIKYFFIIEKSKIFGVLFVYVLVGFIVSLINGAGGIHSISEIVITKNIAINENTPVGQILSYWGIYDNSFKTDISVSFVILLILVIFLDVIISIILGIIIGMIFSIFEIKIRMTESKISEFNDDRNSISKKSILFNSVVLWIMKIVCAGGPIGIIYGIVSSIQFFVMIQ
ncbi:MAG: hypothetical protein LBJ31_04965 [Treponema sp.]|nr:hypothetical protein [Treponema sp.]